MTHPKQWNWGEVKINRSEVHRYTFQNWDFRRISMIYRNLGLLDNFSIKVLPLAWRFQSTKRLFHLTNELEVDHYCFQNSTVQEMFWLLWRSFLRNLSILEKKQRENYQRGWRTKSWKWQHLVEILISGSTSTIISKTTLKQWIYPKTPIRKLNRIKNWIRFAFDLLISYALRF